MCIRDSAGRAWTGLYPNTELDVDLKLVTQKQGPMELGEYLDGMITVSYTHLDVYKRQVQVVFPCVHVDSAGNVFKAKRCYLLFRLQQSLMCMDVEEAVRCV